MFTFVPYLDRDESGVAIGLNISATDVTDSDLAGLVRFPRLRSISLSFTTIGDAGLANFRHLAELELLNLANTAITDMGLAHLKALARLEFLNLVATAVTDVGLSELGSLKSLRELYLNDTKVTAKGEKRLRQVLPGCCICSYPTSQFVSERLRAISSFQQRRVTLFEARRDGRELGIDLNRDRLCRAFSIRPNSRRSHVVEYEELVGVIEGEVSDWSDGHSSGPSMKLAFRCPQCGHVQWGDFCTDEENPALWYSECACTDKWLIHWRRLRKRGEQAERPKKSPDGH